MTTSPAGWLRVGFHATRHRLEISYESDQGDHGSITAEYPFSIEALPSAGRAIAVGIAPYLGQLCLAERIELDFDASEQALLAIRPLVQMLYDVRRWKDGLPLRDAPNIVSQHVTSDGAPMNGALDGGRSLLLWSGGKDSTLSAQLLRANGIQVCPLHVTVNAGVEAVERSAVRRLAYDLDLDLITLQFSHPQFLELSSRYAANWNRYPYYNTVPFGRDLLLALLAAPVAVELGIGLMSFGHDNECRNAVIRHPLRTFPRNDVESADGANALENFIHRGITSELALFPPLAGLSELRILNDMLIHNSSLMSNVSFCFWGTACGRCAKCLRYALAQRLLIPASPVLRFQADPLAEGVCPELDDMLQGDDLSGMLFQRQVMYCLARLCLRKDRNGSTDALDRFQACLLPQVIGHLDAWEEQLFTDHGDPQLPQSFVTDVWTPRPAGLDSGTIVPDRDRHGAERGGG